MDYKLLYKVLLFFIWRFHSRTFVLWMKQVERNTKVKEASEEMISGFTKDGFTDEDL
tara:strand:+ start:193 stop:363 length:171 start_codon:yes stop_codon:yes gene_type:complete